MNNTSTILSLSFILMQCVDIVTEYGPELIKLMDGAINPQELCKVQYIGKLKHLPQLVHK